MRREMSGLLKYDYFCDNIDDFLSNRDNFYDGARVFLEGHYFLSYDYEKYIRELLWSGYELVENWDMRCAKCVVEHFKGDWIPVDVNAFLHEARNSRTDNIDRESILWPEFVWNKRDRILCLESYDTAPRKPKEDKLRCFGFTDLVWGN